MHRGHLRIYLGAAPGVGKTFAMLDEGYRRAQRGTDVVVAYVETHNRPKTAAQVRDLEVIPRQQVEYRGTVLEEMDVDAVIARRPNVALVDEFAHTNAPGSRHVKRWEDVEELLAAGIDVITTVNIQHLESVNDVVERITGVKQRETVPDSVVRAADQVEIVDMAPEALRRRMAHGNVYAPEKVDAALGNYFRIGNLSALRELALLWVADKVDDSLQDYMVVHGIDHSWETRERIVVAVTGAPSGEHLIRRAARMASRAKGDLVGVHISADDGLAAAPSELLDLHRQLLADLGGEYHEVVGSEVAPALLQFAQAEHATQIVLGATHRSRWSELAGGSVINGVIRDAGEIDVHVISQAADPQPEGRSPALGGPRRRPQLSRRRQLAGWFTAGIGIPVVTVVLLTLENSFNLTSVALLFLLLVVVVAVVGGRGPAMAAAVASSLLLNWFFTPPVHTFDIARGENLLALLIFLAVAALVSMVVSQASRRSADVSRSRAEAEALARLAGGMLGEDDPLRDMVSHLRSTFAFDGVSILLPDGAGWAILEATGPSLPLEPGDGESIPLSEEAVLVMKGPALSADDRRVLHVFTAQLNSALERRRLRREASDAAAIAAADQLRTAILRAVSHDLRTPLASIKASVTSLLQHDVEWSEPDREEFLETIDEESDRLNELVGNLLDMSRIESGALDVLMKPVGLEEVVARALASISGSTDRVEVDVSETLPRVIADPALLERALANLTSNALGFSPGDEKVRIEAGEVGDRIDLRIIDRGVGVPPAQRDRMFEPFQRLGDGGDVAELGENVDPDVVTAAAGRDVNGNNGSNVNGSNVNGGNVNGSNGATTAGGANGHSHGVNGVGLGLAVAKGFVEAIGGDLILDDTPGGGLTAIIELRKVAP